LTTAEESKIIHYKFSDDSVFTYRIVNLKDLDTDDIINTVEPKIKKGLKIEGKELVLYALIPMIVDEDMEKYIKRVVNNLLQLRNSTVSLKNLAYGIEWLIVDKFITNEEDRNIICDALGDRMSLIYEYGERKENNGRIEGRREGIKEIINGFLNSGTSLNEISQKTGKSVEELTEILQS
jgi:predicted transposase YdaD